MPMHCTGPIFSVVRTEHMKHTDFFLRCLWFDGGDVPQALTFTCLAQQRVCCRISLGPEETAARLAYSREELARYRDSSLPRITGLGHRPEISFMHQHFSFFSEKAPDRLQIEADCHNGVLREAVPILPYQSENTYLFPLRGTFLVTDTYPSINSHRWCRNSEFAFDVGAFDETLGESTIGGAPVYAACAGTVEEAFDGLEDTGEDTDLENVEARFGEHARIDGNHVLLRHPGDELSLYSHLEKGSVRVRPGEWVEAGQLLGRVGSSGSSWVPHLHFHVMREGIAGPGVPVVFRGLTSLLGEPCQLEDTVNLVRYAPEEGR